jgi:hypothetical protein
MRHASGTDTGLTVAASDFPVIVLDCLRCPRRVVVKPGDLKAPQDQPVYQWRLRCQCGSHDVNRHFRASLSRPMPADFRPSSGVGWQFRVAIHMWKGPRRDTGPYAKVLHSGLSA